MTANDLVTLINGVFALLNIKVNAEPFVSEEELKLVLQGAAQSGQVDIGEQVMIQNVLNMVGPGLHTHTHGIYDFVNLRAHANIICAVLCYAVLLLSSYATLCTAAPTRHPTPRARRRCAR